MRANPPQEDLAIRSRLAQEDWRRVEHRRKIAIVPAHRPMDTEEAGKFLTPPVILSGHSHGNDHVSFSDVD